MPLMKMRVEQMGKSLVVRIPKSVARKNAIVSGTVVELQTPAPTPTVKRRRRSPYRLADILAKGKGRARGKEVDLGPAVGKEMF